jgi:hypothetical protein
MLRRILFFVLLVFGTGRLTVGGNPKYVAGASYFDPVVKGTPLTWTQGQLSHFTDQGDLSALLPHTTANTFVADSFARWTSIPTAAVSARLAGQLAEDVNGTNVSSDGVSVITMPADIQPTATDKPLAIVYDADGTVTDALLGAGAGLAGNCFSNAAFGGVDKFTTDGHLAHALVVMNGNCAQTPSDLPELQYRLVRVLGQVLGLGWSQLNLNVITGSPQAPTAADRAGFPVMHYTDSFQCVPMTLCYPSPDQPRMDDRAALSRMYPVTLQNQSTFAGKSVFSTSTARISGSVYFADSSGQRGQPMQGVTWSRVGLIPQPTKHPASTRHLRFQGSCFGEMLALRSLASRTQPGNGWIGSARMTKLSRVILISQVSRFPMATPQQPTK